MCHQLDWLQSSLLAKLGLYLSVQSYDKESFEISYLLVVKGVEVHINHHEEL